MFIPSEVVKVGHIINVSENFEELVFCIKNLNTYFIIINLFNTNNEVYNTQFTFISKARYLNWQTDHRKHENFLVN